MKEIYTFDDFSQASDFSNTISDLKPHIFEAIDGSYKVEIDLENEKVLGKYLQLNLDQKIFSNGLEAKNFLNNIIQKDKTKIGFFGDIGYSSEDEYLKNVLKRQQNGIFFVQDIPFVLNLDKNNPSFDDRENMKEKFLKLKDFFGENFFVLIVTLGKYSSFRDCNIILYPKKVEKYYGDFESYRKALHKIQNENNLDFLD